MASSSKASSITISADDDIFRVWNGFRFQLVEEEWWPDIMQHIMDHFMKDEVMIKSLGCTDDVLTAMKLHLQISYATGKHLCLVAFDQKSGKLAGVRISRVSTKGEVIKSDQFAVGPNAIKLVRTLLEIQAPVDLFSQFGVDEIHEFILVSIDREYRRRGLAYQLVLRSMRLAKKHGLKAGKGIFTSMYSIHIAEKLGMVTVNEFKYDTYKQDGKIVFKNTEPHQTVKHMARSYTDDDSPILPANSDGLFV